MAVKKMNKEQFFVFYKEHIEDKNALSLAISDNEKTVYDCALENDELLCFLMKEELISISDIDRYIFDVSWIEKPQLAKKLLDYRKNPPQKQVEIAEKKAKEKEENPLEKLKADWMTEKLKDGTLCLKSYKGKDKIVKIPDIIGKNKVSTIGTEAFSPERLRINNAEIRRVIEEVVISEGITTIEANAFNGCTNLQKVNLPQSLCFIKENAFTNCHKLKEIEIPSNIEEISKYAFVDTGL